MKAGIAALQSSRWPTSTLRGRRSHRAVVRDRVGRIIDDTGFLKQGKHSVGVQRQYTGSAGKTTNCQVAVSLTVATSTAHLPIDFDLYLPTCWTEDAKRRSEGRIPAEISFRTKPQIALDMISRAVQGGVPKGIVLADAGYGNGSEFRAGVRALGLEYGVAIQGTNLLWRLGQNEQIVGDAISAQDLARQLTEEDFRRCTWRDGTGGGLSARFAAYRVASAHKDALVDRSDREAIWILIEWRDGEAEPTHFHLCSLPQSTTRKQMVRLIKERYRTERAYEELKGEFGLDHFEGRRYSGWHHHVSVVLCCFAFAAAEIARRFPPSAADETIVDSVTAAA